MNRRLIFLTVFIVAILAMTILIVSKKTNNSNSLLSQKNNPSESEALVDANSSAINSVSAQVSATIPAISDSDQLLSGEKGAALEMVVYEDLTNPFSLSYSQILQQVEKEFSGKLAIYVRPYFESDNSLALSYQAAVVCAGKSGKFNELRSFIFEQKPLTTAALVDGAKKIGLNGSQFSTCLNNSELQVKIARSVEDIRMIAVFGAPTSILAGEVITGARSMDDIKNGEGQSIEGLRSIINRHLGVK